MFEMLQKFVLLTASAGCVVLIYVSIMRIVQGIKRRIMRIRSRYMVEYAQRVGPVLYYNEVGRTMAVCRAGDFNSLVQNQKDYKPWEVLKPIRIRPTFLFRKDDDLRIKMQVVVTEAEVRLMIDELVTKITGYTRKQVDKTSFEKASKALIRKNVQLFVPFATELSDEEGQKQVNFYGNTPPFDQVHHYLLDQ
jgi:hypothetical protein